jgi:hypothetical protein
VERRGEGSRRIGMRREERREKRRRGEERRERRGGGEERREEGSMATGIGLLLSIEAQCE